MRPWSRCTGDRDSMVLVCGMCLHRWLSRPELAVPDLRGHGRSDLAGPASWTLDDWADDLAGVIDALQLLGSLGGAGVCAQPMGVGEAGGAEHGDSPGLDGSARPWWTSAGTCRPRPEWRCPSFVPVGVVEPVISGWSQKWSQKPRTSTAFIGEPRTARSRLMPVDLRRQGH